MKKGKIREIITDLDYIFLNCFVNRIPIWTVRKLIYKCKGLKLAKNARVGIKTVIIRPKKIRIGERSKINEYCYLDGRGGISIGNDVSVSIYAKIITGSHDISSNRFEYKANQIIIEDNVWIGANTLILEGSILHLMSVIGAGSVMKGEAEAKGIYSGNLAFKIGDRNLKTKYKQLEKWYFR